MKYAILSDIHGNLPALQAVLADAQARGADEYIITGDYCISLPWPEEVITTLRNLQYAHIIKGNEERYLIDREGADQSAWTDGQFEVTYWCMRNTTEENRKYLHQLPDRLNFERDGVKIHMAHSSEAFIGSAEHGRFKSSMIPGRYARRPDHARHLKDIRDEIIQSADYLRVRDKLEPGVYLFGHSHVQWFANIDNHVFINPGSCGAPLDLEDWGASYTLLTIENGSIDAEERRAKYDMQGLIHSLRDSDQYRAAQVWTELVIQTLSARREVMAYFLPFAERFANARGDMRRPYSKETWRAAHRAWSRLSDEDIQAIERERYLISL